MFAKVDFYNRIQDIPVPDNLYDEIKGERYLLDISCGSFCLIHFIYHAYYATFLEKKAQYAYPFQLIIPASYQLKCSEKAALTPEFSYQYNGGIIDNNYFSTGSELSLNNFLFLRMGCTMEVKKYQAGEFESQIEDPVETALGLALDWIFSKVLS